VRQEWPLRLSSGSSCWLQPFPASGTAPSPGAGPAFATSHAAVDAQDTMTGTTASSSSPRCHQHLRPGERSGYGRVPARGRQHPHHMSSYSAPRCQYQQRNPSQETIALLFPSGMTDPYLHTHVLTTSPSTLHKAYSTLSSSSSSPFPCAQHASHATLSKSTTPAASGRGAGTFGRMLLGCRAQQHPPPWTVEGGEEKMGISDKPEGRNPQRGTTGETQVLWQEEAQCWMLCERRTPRHWG